MSRSHCSTPTALLQLRCYFPATNVLPALPRPSPAPTALPPLPGRALNILDSVLPPPVLFERQCCCPALLAVSVRLAAPRIHCMLIS